MSHWKRNPPIAAAVASSSDGATALPQPKTYLVISVVGQDRPGIVRELSHVIAEQGCNIEDSRMAVLGGEFAAIILVEGRWNTLAKIENALPELSRSLDLTLFAKRTGPRPTDRSLLPYAVEAVSMDHPGIVHSLADFFAARDINIEEMATHAYPAPHTGTPMFSVHMTVGIPAGTHIAGLREEFMDTCDAMNLDAVLEPFKS